MCNTVYVLTLLFYTTCTKCGTTALLYAARKGHTDVLRELLLAGASINLANKVM